MTLTGSNHEDRLDKLAELAIRVGLGLGSGQELVITAPVETLPLVRRITAHAYQAGASLVTTLLTDEESTLLRFRHGSDAGFDKAATWLQEGVANAYRSGAARLAITGGNPALLAGQDPGKVARANLAFSKASRPALDLITRHEINWSIVPFATPAWAALVFPDLPSNDAVARLWDAIFAATRVDTPDPVAAWQTHQAALARRVDYLNSKSYSALRYAGPGTNVTVGLATDHLWLGGGTVAGNGLACLPNMPTEEVFTTPHRERVDGQVTSTKPLSYQGMLIRDIRVRFENGRIVESSASTGADVLEQMLNSDEGARRLGEVALVPHSSPISASGLLFWNTLFDENAASHIALGQAYSTCIRGGDAMSPFQLANTGANESLIHVDWMIGSAQMDIDGITEDNTAEPLMRAGEWV